MILHPLLFRPSTNNFYDRILQSIKGSQQNLYALFRRESPHK